MAIRDWLGDAWEWFVPGEDDQGIFKNIFGGDDDYESEFDDELFSTLGIDPTTDPDTWIDAVTDTIIPMEESEWTDEAGYEDWIDSWLDATGAESTGDLTSSWMDEFNAPETGIFGGTLGPKLANFFLGSGGTRGTGGNRQGGGILGALTGLLGGGGQGGGGLLGGGGLGTLASLWALNKARKEGDDPGAVIPMGQQTYGMDDVYGGPTQDYRVFNIQPALMPGVAYANVGKPEGMKGGGIASLDGPGDVTPAWLEPGEFVMTKKATGNIGAQNLYKMMKEAEGMS